MACPHCPHCIASGSFGLIDPKNPALAGTPALRPKRRDRANEKAAIESLRVAYNKIFQIAYQTKDTGALALNGVLGHVMLSIERRWM